MIKILFSLFVLGVFGLVTSSVFAGMVFAGVARFLRSRRRRPARVYLPAVSLLKPLHGAEPELDEHLSTFFEQDYPEYEILFCARDREDQGVQIAREVAQRYPHIPVQFLFVDGPTHVNAKVSSLQRMEAAAAYDLFVISDSDVRVTPGYLRAVVADFADPAVGASTCLYRGIAKQGFWAQLEASGMSVEMTSGVMAASVMEEMRFLLGPTMSMRRECVRGIGGFATLGDYCSDDFLLGREIAGLGYKVVLSGHVIDHIVLNQSFTTSIKHQVRWMKSTRFSRPKGHFGTGLTFSVPFGLLAGAAALALGHPLAGVGLVAYGILNRMLLAGVVAGLVVEDGALLRTMMLYPLRDLMGFFFWAASYTSGTILWRGRVYRLGASGLMQPAGE
ncbi:MAG TPA: glycosyltransferase [Acidobacteriaceae bacterium]